MILAIGEILVDIILETSNQLKQQCSMYVGGAPFNVVVNAHYCRAGVAFIGRIGNDIIGKHILKVIKKYSLPDINIQIDKQRNTTLAFVSLLNGERDFSFFRSNTADYHVKINNQVINKIKEANTICVGSLFLSTINGCNVVDKILNIAKESSKRIAFDVNLRMDLYTNYKTIRNKYERLIKEADIIKFSKEELLFFSGEMDIKTSIKKLARKDQLLVITLGSTGSMYYYNNEFNFIPSSPIIPIDSTGAGDAFFGALLSFIDKYNISFTNKRQLDEAFDYANKIGRLAVQYKGALSHVEEIKKVL